MKGHKPAGTAQVIFRTNKGYYMGFYKYSNNRWYVDCNGEDIYFYDTDVLEWWPLPEKGTGE